MLIEMKVSGLTMDPTSELPILILKDQQQRSLPIWIGLPGAGSIASELQQVQPGRPTTHDLMADLLRGLDASLSRVKIHDYRNDTYYAVMEIRHGGGTLELDCRPADAIVLALRTGSSIQVEQQVIEKAAHVDLRNAPEEHGSERTPRADLLANMSDEEFGKWKM